MTDYYKSRLDEVLGVILAAIEGHQTYATRGGRDSGLPPLADEYGQCKCQACGIARAARVGQAQCIEQAAEANKKARAAEDEEDRAYYAREFPYTDEVPF